MTAARAINVARALHADLGALSPGHRVEARQDVGWSMVVVLWLDGTTEEIRTERAVVAFRRRLGLTVPR